MLFCFEKDFVMNRNEKRVKYACYVANITMSVVGNLSPVLFLTFRSLYGISYSLLGLLVLLNFCTQLGIDLIFSFFSHRFNISKTVKAIPYISVVGLFIYGLFPLFFPQWAYAGLVVGTVIFSAASGLAEVLISPTVAALPSEDPDREMSRLHSSYAWGVVGVIIFSTLYLLLFGGENWQGLALIFSAIPLLSALLFFKTELPKMETPEKASGALHLLENKGVWISFFAIFFGGAAECTMSQWASGYLEQALSIPKVWGDIFGVAMFALFLGLGRSLYGKYGKNIEKVILLCGIGATACYLVAALSPFPILGLFACAFTGFATSMLWPGNLIVAAERFPSGGVFIYALMAAGGDLGVSVAPQLVGIVTDVAVAHPTVMSLAQTFSLTPEQLGMKLGILVGSLFPLLGIFVYAYLYKTRKKNL